MIDVSIIIVNYNTCRMTQECIDSIYEKTREVEFEVILVDNASKDGSKEHFSHDSRIHYVYCEKNGGFGYGNNLGVKHAKGKYVFLLNSDTLLKNNAIKMFYDFSEAQAKPCVCGAWLLDRDGNPNTSQVAFPRMNIKEFIKSFISKPEPDDRNSTKAVDVVCGADMFLPKEVYDKSGGFDEAIFMYGEEVELQYRLKLMGVARYIIPGPQIVHFGKGSANSSSKSKNLYRSHFIFLKKHMTPFNYCCARAYYAVNLSLRKLLG